MKIKNESGFMMVTTIFIIVILSLIATFIVQTSMVTSQSENLDLLETRAYFAAKSGLEWLNYQTGRIYLGSTCPASAPACPSSPTTLNLTEGGLKGFTVVVTCSVVTFTEDGTNYYSMFTGKAIATFASSNSSINYVSNTSSQVVASFCAPNR